MNASCNSSAVAANRARYALLAAARDPELARRVVAGETLKVVGLDSGLTRERMLQICDRQGVRTVRRRPELRAGSEDSTFRLEVGIRAGLSFSMATSALAGFSPKPALIQKLPADIAPLIAPKPPQVRQRRLFGNQQG